MAKDHFYFQRQRYDVIDRIAMGRKVYLVVEQLSHGLRNRYKAFDPHAGTQGAMRVIHILPRSQESWNRVRDLERLGKENRELPQIVEVHRLGDQLGIVQIWIEGRDLQSWIQQMRRSGRQRVGTPEAVRLFRGLAHALRNLHGRCKLVHADIKPSNIVLSSESRRLVLIDYGSAWRVEQTTQRSEGDGKSQHYAAPEILSGSVRVDFRADYFSLAAVCYEVLTLELPYNGLGGGAAMLGAENDPESLYIPPSKLSADFSKLEKSTWKAIDELLYSSLQIDPDQRIGDVSLWLRKWDEVVELSRKPPQLNWLNRLIVVCLDRLSGTRRQ